MLNPVVDFSASGVTERVAERLFVKVGTRIKQVDMADIVYAEATGNYIGLVMNGGEIIHAKEPIGHLECRLSKLLFIRVHRSYIVNVNCLKEIKAGQNGYVLTLSNGIQIISGSTYKKSIRARFLMNLQPDHQSDLSPCSDSKIVDFPRAAAAHGNDRRLSKHTHIRPCAPGDEDALAFVGKATFIETYTGAFRNEDLLAHCVNHDSPVTFRAWLKSTKARTWIVETETCNAPVGYFVVAPPSLPFSGLRDDDLEIHRIYLLKLFQNDGLGKSLITKITQYAIQNGFKRIVLSDYKNNERSANFYERSGFRPIGQYLCRRGDHDYEHTVYGLEL